MVGRRAANGGLGHTKAYARNKKRGVLTDTALFMLWSSIELNCPHTQKKSTPEGQSFTPPTKPRTIVSMSEKKTVLPSFELVRKVRV